MPAAGLAEYGIQNVGRDSAHSTSHFPRRICSDLPLLFCGFAQLRIAIVGQSPLEDGEHLFGALCLSHTQYT